ncbi:MAG TPA: putative baseplate assembly protein [Thermoanaerobaculia bacterium]|nr:putative baseplate assembly protein [Thermoanaerobaculia bacterium]
MSATADDFLRRRRAAVARHASQIGLDFLSVVPDSTDTTRRVVALQFLPGDPGKQAAPATLSTDNFRFTAGSVSVAGLFTLEIPERGMTTAPGETTVTFGMRFAGDADSTRRLGGAPVLTLELAGVPNLDPFFSRLDFSLDLDAPLAEDCPDDHAPAAEMEPPLASDYLAKDFASFLQKMLDHLAHKLPEWTERSPADLLVTLVELLADAGDQASYHQDAVATEAYLGTARLRTSVRRHARLVGYHVHEGSGARVWAHLTTDAPATLPAGTLLLTQVPGFGVLLGPDELAQALLSNPEVFETLEGVSLLSDRNEMQLYAWGAEEFVLPQGATSATLVGRFPGLGPGDVLILEQVLDETTGLPVDSGRSLRQAVRLTRVAPGEDPIGPSGLSVNLTEIEWHPEDALPAPLCLATRIGAVVPTGMAVARGNVVLADCGRRAPAETLTVTSGRFQPRLRFQGLTWQVPWDATAARDRSAASALVPDPRLAVPAIELSEPGRNWAAKKDLLGSDRFADDFVVEMEEDGTATLRFGDGTLGRPPAPGSVLTATYRVGNGTAGNIGRDNLYHLASDVIGVTAVRNPLAAAGGTDPEPLDNVRLAAPGFIDALENESTLEDIVARIEADPETEVEWADASLRWTGSWYALELAVRRKGGLPVDTEFASRLSAILEDVRIAGWELAILPLSFVGLDIALTIILDPDAFRGQTEQTLLDTFSNRDLPGGRRGFFHLANLSPGQPVYLSGIVEAALAVPGVHAVDFGQTSSPLNRFRRFGEPSHGEIEAGRIRLRRGELPRVDNDPAAPENGRIQFFMEGGR